MVLTCVVRERNAGERAVFLLPRAQPVHLVHEQCQRGLVAAPCASPWGLAAGPCAHPRGVAAARVLALAESLISTPAGAIWSSIFLSLSRLSTWALYAQPETRPKLKSYSASSCKAGCHCCCSLADSGAVSSIPQCSFCGLDCGLVTEITQKAFGGWNWREEIEFVCLTSSGYLLETSPGADQGTRLTWGENYLICV